VDGRFAYSSDCRSLRLVEYGSDGVMGRVGSFRDALRAEQHDDMWAECAITNKDHRLLSNKLHSSKLMHW
jgi:hypothetical protein